MRETLVQLHKLCQQLCQLNVVLVFDITLHFPRSRACSPVRIQHVSIMDSDFRPEQTK